MKYMHHKNMTPCVLSEQKNLQTAVQRLFLEIRMVPNRMVSKAIWLLLFGLLIFTPTGNLINTRQAVPYQESFVDQCTPVPTWTIGGERVVNLVGQNVTVIALLNSSRPFGRKQAAKLSSLRIRLHQAGFSAINFMMINSKLATEDTDLLRNEAVDIPVYQEQPGEHVQDIFGAADDHILVLDRCGRLAYQIITPFSQLTYPYVKAAILSTYKDNPCGFCNASKFVNNLSDNEGDVDTSLVHLSDAPGLIVSSQQNMSVFETTRNPVIKEQIEQYDMNKQLNQTHPKDSPSSERIVPMRKNGLMHSFIQTSSTQNSQKNSSTLMNGSSEHAAVNSVNWAQVLKRDSEVVSNRIIPHLHQLNQTKETNNQQENGQASDIGQNNWDWSQMRKNHGNVKAGTLEDGEGQSVEVVRHVEHSKRKKKKNNKLSRGSGKETEEFLNDTVTFANQATECKALQQCTSSRNNSTVQEIFSNSEQEMMANSMRQYVNQSQKLLDWYQKQIQIDASQEEKCGKTSNSVRCRIIAHYQKLLPWIDYPLELNIRAEV